MPISPSNPTRVPISELPRSYTSNNEKCPSKGLQFLRKSGLLHINLPLEFGGEGHGLQSGNIQLLEQLKKVGAYDLSLGRIYEGHLNALLLVQRFGNRKQLERYSKDAAAGMVFGIWNSEIPTEPLKFNGNDKCFTLKGSKVFCSGANHVDRPIVTADGPDGSSMVILHLDEYRLKEDYRYWQPFGMKSSVSCRFDFTEQKFEKSQLLGEPYDYVREPDFSGGAIRFAAVQLGGAHAAAKATFDHLYNYKRTKAPDQVRRLGKLRILLKTGDLWLQHAGKIMDHRYHAPDECVEYANMFRTLTRELCEKVLRLSEMSVGLQGMMAPHPLERIHRDLSVYLKQPGPDRALNQIGESFSIQ